MASKIQPEEFGVLSSFIYNISGIHLDASKTYLIETRLGGMLQEQGCSTYSELYYKAKADTSRALINRIIDAITTGETLFFRDAAPFELLQHKILPDLIDRRTRKATPGLQIPLRIWSMACSTGQEVYSIAIVLKELGLDNPRYTLRLLGTDISDQAIARASYGKYNRFEIERGLPKEKLTKYFAAEKETWKIRDEIRAMATFRKINLMENFDHLGKFDIIFCRNVAIYFTEADKIKLFARIERSLEPDGYLLIGSTESLSGICPQFESRRYLRSVFYQLKNAPA